MFIVHIRIHDDALDDSDRLATHRAWFSKHYEYGDFLIVGPCPDVPGSGMLLTREMERAQLDEILANDAYHDGGAEYAVYQYKPALIAEGLTEKLHSG